MNPAQDLCYGYQNVEEMASTSLSMPVRKGHGRDRDTWGSASPHHLPTQLLLPIIEGFRDIFPLVGGGRG